MKKLLKIFSIMAILSAGLNQPALADPGSNEGCSEGKSPITITTPSGKINTLCVSNSALPGLETAGENSEATITPAVCSCFSSEDIDTIIGGASYIYEHRFWDSYPDGDVGACETVVIRASGGMAGAGTRADSPTQGCITTDEIPTANITPNGCALFDNSSYLFQNPIDTDESAACLSILKQYSLE